MRERISRIAVLALLVAILSSSFVPAHVVTANGALTGKKICLDPGHGGSDPGAVYDDGTIYLEEADINLDVAYGLKALLEADGAEVVMTRIDGSYKTNAERYTTANSNEATILVSIHTNSVLLNPDTRDGAMTLYFKREDKPLAQAIHNVMYLALEESAPNTVEFRDFGLAKFAARILMSSEMPATILEPVCMSHPDEAARLTVTIHDVDEEGVVELDADGNPTSNSECDDCRRAQIAQAIHDGIVGYFAGPEPTPEPGGVMHVEAIEMELATVQRGTNLWTYAIAKVTILDQDGLPVEGATVHGHWSGATSDSDTGVTGADGKVSLESDKVKNVPSEITFTFTVDHVSKAGWTYDDSGESSDSIGS